MGLFDKLKSIKKEYTTIDGVKFEVKPNFSGKYSELVEDKHCYVLKKDGVTYNLSDLALKTDDGNINKNLRRWAYVKDVDSSIKKLVLEPVEYNGKTYEFGGIDTSVKLNGLSSLNTVKIGKISWQQTWEYAAHCFEGCKNIKNAAVTNKSYVAYILLSSTPLAFAKAKIGLSSKLLIPDSYVAAGQLVRKTEKATKYGVETITDKQIGLFSEAKHIDVLSIPSRFGLSVLDFTTREDVDKFNKKGECIGSTTLYQSCPIKNIIIREDKDSNYDYSISICLFNNDTDIKRWHDVFGNVTLYVHKKHLKSIDNVLGKKIFKCIKTFEELPKEYSDMIK